MRTLLSLAAGAALAVVAGAGASGCGCADDSVAVIAGGTYGLVEPDPTPYVGYALTYVQADGTVRETYTRNGVVHDTRYAVTAVSP